MHLIIYFDGTRGSPFPTLFCGDDSDPTEPMRENLNSYCQGVSNLQIAGCNHKDVCDSICMPNLKKFAKKFVSGLFKRDAHLENQLLFTEGDLPEKKIGILDGSIQREPITSITLCGFSRGAVTCFNVARELKKMVPDLPVDIVADQPVPGNIYPTPLSNAAEIADCRDLTNVRNVSIILSSYTETLLDSLRSPFMSQIVPILPPTIKRDIIVIPDIQHAHADAHFHLEIAKSLKRHVSDVNFDAAIKNWTEMVESNYRDDQYRLDSIVGRHSVHNIPLRNNVLYISEASTERFTYFVLNPNNERVTGTITIRELGVTAENESFYNVSSWFSGSDPNRYIMRLRAKLPEILKITSGRGHTEIYQERKKNRFIQPSNIRTIFGISRQDLRFFTDPHSPMQLAYRLDTNKSLMQWWVANDAARRETKETKVLKEVLNVTQWNKMSLMNAFEAVNRWLIQKENKKTSRFAMVQFLRDNLYDLIVTQFHGNPVDLLQTRHEVLKKQQYFFKNWNRLSKAASFRQTKETDSLDEAFKEHAENHLPTDDFIGKLNDWLAIKKLTKSKRIDLVTQMRDYLQMIVKIEEENNLNCFRSQPINLDCPPRCG